MILDFQCSTAHQHYSLNLRLRNKLFYWPVWSHSAGISMFWWKTTVTDPGLARLRALTLAGGRQPIILAIFWGNCIKFRKTIAPRGEARVHRDPPMNNHLQQECISVGCVPPTAVAISGGGGLLIHPPTPPEADLPGARHPPPLWTE